MHLAPSPMPDANRPCIRCGACDRVVRRMTDGASARPYPQAILAALRRGEDERALELGLDARIHWHACDAVCPTGIALASIFSEKLAALAQKHAEHERALIWREHFRAREARLAREEREAAEQRTRRSARPAVQDAVAAALARARKARGEDVSE